MEEAPERASVALAQDVQRMGRSYSERSLSAFSVDENVLELLWDEEVHMEELLEFSFDHVDKLAARRGTSVTSMEKLRLWDYIQQMRLEEPYWATPETVPWDEVEARYALPSVTLPEELSRDLLFCDRSLASAAASPLTNRTPLDNRKSETAAEVTARGHKLFDGHLLQPAERFSLSEEWNSGSQRGRTGTSAASGGRWRRRLRRLLGTVFRHPPAKNASSKAASPGELETTATGAASTSKALPDNDPQPGAPTTGSKQRPGGLLRRSLRRMALGAKKRRDPTNQPEAGND